MKNICSFLSRRKYFCILLLLVPLLIWFQYLELTVVPRYVTATALDHKIPFTKEFAVPYLLWFLFVPCGVVYVGIHSRRDFYKLFLFLFFGLLAADLTFALFPNAQDLRPAIDSGDPLSLLARWIYSVDTPTNVCPSIHVIDSIAMNAALQHSDAFSAKKSRKVASSVLTVLICLSTVFMKQHSVFDVICGIVLSALFYIPLYIIPKRRSQNEREALRDEPFPTGSPTGGIRK